ncbi:DUF5914 domain-containing protein [Streptomyces flaveolus]|uniref:DUF5914 domain-containing protein n=1 Tax=Streptomyces flaveolus TaxID=67297 RepID=UPI0036C6C279
MNQDHRPRRGRYPLRLRRRPVPRQRQRPTWREARPAVIAGALERALARPSGNWYVVGADRPGFPVVRRLAPVLRPLMRAAAGRLWRDDLAYAERRRDLRRRGPFPC